MNVSFAEQIQGLVKSGRISHAIAEALIEHYSKQPGSLRGEAGGVPAQVDLMELMNLIDLMEKKDPPETSGALLEAPSLQAISSETPGAFRQKQEDEYPMALEAVPERPSAQKEAACSGDLEKKCARLEWELAAERKAHEESSKMEFVYAKRYADAQAERRQAHADEEDKRKALEEENSRLTDELKRIREDVANAGKKVEEPDVAANVANELIQKLEEQASVRMSLEEAKARLETEKMGLAKDLEMKTEDVVRLQSRVRELEEASEKREQWIQVLETEKQGEVTTREASVAAAAEQRRFAENIFEQERLVFAEEKNRFERERVALLAEISEKASEAARLQASLREASESLERVKGQILGLENDLQQAHQGSELLRFEKERLEKEKQEAMKAGEERAAAVPALEKAKARLETEKLGLEKDLACLEEERLRLGKDLEGRAAELAVSEQERARLAGEVEKKREELDTASSRIKELEEAVACAGVQIQEAKKQCSDLERAKEERDEKVRLADELAQALREKEALLNEKAILQKALEEKLAEEEKAHSQAKAHALRLEATLLDLEKKIDALITPPAPQA